MLIRPQAAAPTWRPPLFERREAPAPPALQEVPAGDHELLGMAGLLAIPATGILLGLLTDLNLAQNALLSGLAGGLGVVLSAGLATWLDGRSQDAQNANAARQRRYQVELSQHGQQASTGKPLSPWPRLEALAGQKAALKTLLSGPESAALTLALENLRDQRVVLDLTPEQLLERSPAKLGCSARLPEGKCVGIADLKDLRRLDLAYGHSDPEPYARALNSLLDQSYTVSPSLRVEPDSQSTQSRYEAFQLVEVDRAGGVDWTGTVTLSLHHELVAQEFFSGSGQDHGLGEPGLAHHLKDLYAGGLKVFHDGRRLETPLDAYRAQVMGCRTWVARDEKSPAALPVEVGLEEYGAWEQAAHRCFRDMNANFLPRQAVQDLYASQREGFLPEQLAQSFATVHRSLTNAFCYEATPLFRQLLDQSQTPQELEALSRAFAAEPRWSHKVGIWNQLEDFQRHNQATVQRVLSARELERSREALSGNPGRLQRGIEKLADMVLVGGTRLRSRAG